ncbi:MAG: SH3 domain-containing protein [Fusicatenibacter sp.]
MRLKKSYVFGIVGSVLTLTGIMAAPVKAETNDTTSKVTKEESILDTQDWSNMAAANVETYANIRSNASTECEAVGVLLPGHAADVLEQGETWSKISSNGLEGYIRNDLLVFGEEAKAHYSNTCGVTGTVQADSLRVRQEPSTEAKQVGNLSANSEVKILGETDNWYEISYAGGSAYLHGDYVTLDDTLKGAMSMEEYQKQVAKSASAGISASSGDLAMLAALIECEAGGESRQGKVAVGAVVLNRVRSGSFPNSISGVIYERGQFSPVSSGKFQRVLSRGARSDCYEAASAALAGENPIGSCLYFNSGYGRGIQIGYQHFY